MTRAELAASLAPVLAAQTAEQAALAAGHAAEVVLAARVAVLEATVLELQLEIDALGILIS